MYFFAAHFSKYNKYNWDQDPDPLKRKQLSSIEGFFVTERNVNIYKKTRTNCPYAATFFGYIFH